eukprot:5634399-Prorocentrum_lima.AAC.1
MGDDILADKIDEPSAVQLDHSPLQEGQMDVAPDPSVALQQHLESCHAALNSALQQTMENAQQHIQQVVQQALLSALDEVPALLAARQPGEVSTPPCGPSFQASAQAPLQEPPIVSVPALTAPSEEVAEDIPGPAALLDP